MRRMLMLMLVLLVAPVLAADDTPVKPMAAEPFAEFVSPADSLPHMRYLADGLVTMNDRCPVRKVRLNPMMGASYVNGRPVGFC